jgi:ABC-type glutathione transport system ATPase component
MGLFHPTSTLVVCSCFSAILLTNTLIIPIPAVKFLVKTPKMSIQHEKNARVAGQRLALDQRWSSRVGSDYQHLCSLFYRVQHHFDHDGVVHAPMLREHDAKAESNAPLVANSEAILDSNHVAADSRAVCKVAVFGASGCGKTATARTLTGRGESSYNEQVQVQVCMCVSCRVVSFLPLMPLFSLS